MSTQLPQLDSPSLPRPINRNEPFGVSKGMYSEREEQEYAKPVAEAEIRFRFVGSYGGSTRLLPRRRFDVDIAVTETQQHPNEQEIIKQAFHILASELSQKHRGISVNESVLGGMPRLEGLRVSVPNVLTHLYHLGSIDAVVAEFEQRISKEQIREAIAYAHDFMEMACDPSEGDD